MEIVWWVGFLHAQSFLVVVLFGWYNIIPRFPHVLPSIHISIADLGWYYVSYWYWVEMHIFLWSNQLNPSSTCTSGGNIWLIAWAGHLEMIRTVGVLLVQLKYESIESNWFFFSISLSLSLSTSCPEVFQSFFWMQLHGSGSPKRTVMMGNLSTLGTLDKGKLTAKERVKRTKVRTTRTLAKRTVIETHLWWTHVSHPRLYSHHTNWIAISQLR